MEKIIEEYNVLIKKYKEIEKESTEQEIHDKRVTLRRIFSILEVFKIKASKVRNGKKTFALFGELRDVQVQILKLENSELAPALPEYLIFLREMEIKLKEKVEKLSTKKKLKFPSLKKKLKVDASRIQNNTSKLLQKLIDNTQLEMIDDVDEIHKIRISFKKFRYSVEILAFVRIINDNQLYKLKTYQDKLGEIQDYEVLIKGITRFYNRKPNYEINLELFEIAQNALIESFENEVQCFIDECKATISHNNQEREIVTTAEFISDHTLSETYTEDENNVNKIDMLTPAPADKPKTVKPKKIKTEIPLNEEVHLLNEIPQITEEKSGDSVEKQIQTAKKPSTRKKPLKTTPDSEN